MQPPDADTLVAIFAAIQEHTKETKSKTKVSGRMKLPNWRKKHIATFTDRKLKSPKIAP